MQTVKNICFPIILSTLLFENDKQGEIFVVVWVFLSLTPAMLLKYIMDFFFSFFGWGRPQGEWFLLNLLYYNHTILR